MIKVALVLAAGYKTVGWGFVKVPPVCPEALLPIGEQYGGTPIARICTQLSNLGWKSFVTVGQPGSRYTGILNKAVINTTSHFPAEALPEADKPPWTYERLQYVAQYGIPLLMSNPDMNGPIDSAMQSLDLIGTDWWDVLAIFLCDHIWTDDGLREVLTYKASCQITLPKSTVAKILTPKTARIFRRLGESYRRRRRNFTLRQKSVWGEALLPPDGWKFARHAPYRSAPNASVCTEDIDTPGSYIRLVKEWLPKYG